MESYQINDLERLTGIKAHTIRIWEKRYGLIVPNRTDTNRRYYDDAQVRKLLNVTTLLTFGHKISKIAAMSDSDIHNLIENQQSSSGADPMFASYINDLIGCLLSFDEAGFEKVFSASVLRVGLSETMLKVIYPFLIKAGILWTVNKTIPVQEHFASCIIRRKLMAAIDGVIPMARKEAKFLLFLPPDEWHEIGLLFSDYVLRSNGYNTVYLGANLPVEDVAEIAATVNPQFLLIFFVASRSVEEVNKLIEHYSGISTNIKVLITGSHELLSGVKLPKNTKWLTGVNDLHELMQWVN
jgi:DNA-binding transcriptional MerR regulator